MLMDLAKIVREKGYFHLATFLRWYDPDQVRRVKNLSFFSQPVYQGTPSSKNLIN